MIIYAVITALVLVVDEFFHIGNFHPLISISIHVLIVVSILLVAHLLVQRSIQSFRKAEVLLKTARNELEVKVADRTAELERLNQVLRQEISEREKAEIDRENLLHENETAKLRALELVDDLHLANTMLLTLIDALPAGLIIVDSQGEIILENALARKILKSTASAREIHFQNPPATGAKPFFSLNSDGSPLALALQGESTTGLEAAVQLADGKSIYLLIAATPVHDKDGHITHAVEIMQDITSLKELENALRQSEEKYRTQFDAFSEPITVWNREGILLMQNKISLTKLYGEKTNLIGLPDEQIPPDYARMFIQRIQRVIDTNVTEYQEDAFDLPSGKRFFWTCTQRICGPGNFLSAQIISYDITERRRSEDALRSSETKFWHGSKLNEQNFTN